KSNAAPTSPPTIEGPTSMSIHRLLSPSSRLKPSIPPSDPGHSDTVLVTFAWMGSTPTQMSAGKLTRVPPPATELIMPARKPGAKTGSIGHVIMGADYHGRDAGRREGASGRRGDMRYGVAPSPIRPLASSPLRPLAPSLLLPPLRIS